MEVFLVLEFGYETFVYFEVGVVAFVVFEVSGGVFGFFDLSVVIFVFREVDLDGGLGLGVSGSTFFFYEGFREGLVSSEVSGVLIIIYYVGIEVLGWFLVVFAVFRDRIESSGDSFGYISGLDVVLSISFLEFEWIS